MKDHHSVPKSGGNRQIPERANHLHTKYGGKNPRWMSRTIGNVTVPKSSKYTPNQRAPNSHSSSSMMMKVLISHKELTPSKLCTSSIKHLEGKRNKEKPL